MDLQRELAALGLDVTLIGLTDEYAAWLAEHKDLEPDWTWLEVVGGVGLCLTHAAASAALRGGDWRSGWAQSVRSLAIGAVPVVVGEIRRWRRRREERSRYARLRQ